jgi:hypothetical protein
MEFLDMGQIPATTTFMTNIGNHRYWKLTIDEFVKENVIQ